MTATAAPALDPATSLPPAGVRSFNTLADYLTAWHTVPAGRYLLLHVAGCARIAEQERFFGADPVYEFTGFTARHTSNLDLYTEHHHRSLPCGCLPSPDYFAELPDATHWHPARKADDARYAVIRQVEGQWRPWPGARANTRQTNWYSSGLMLWSCR